MFKIVLHICFCCFRADAHKQRQQQQQQQQEGSEISSDAGAARTSAKVLNQDQRQALKFGFSKIGPSKVSEVGF